MPKDTPDEEDPSCSNRLLDWLDGLNGACPNPLEPPNIGLLPKDGDPPNTALPPNAGAPPNDGVPPNAGVPPKAGLLNADVPGEPNPLCATLPVVGVLNAPPPPPTGVGDPKLLLPNPDAPVVAPPKIDCPDCGELGCPNADVPKPPVEAPELTPPKIFPVLVLAVAPTPPKAEVPPKMDPPAAEGLATDPNNPPPLLGAVALPKMLVAVVAGATVAAPNGLAGCCVPAVAPPKMEAVLEGGELTEPKRLLPEVPPEAAPNGELVALAVPKIDPPEAGPLVATDPKSPVPAGLLALVTAAAAVDPNTEMGFEVSAVTAPNAEVVPAAAPPPKMDVVASDLGVAKEAVPKMFPEEALGAAGLEGEQMLKEPNRFDVASVVEVGVAVSEAVVIVVAEDEVTEPNEKPEEVVVVVAVVVTVEEDGTADEAVEVLVVVTVVVAELGALDATEANRGVASLVAGSVLTERSVGLLAAPAAANEKPLLAPPKENPVLLVTVVVAAGLTDPNKGVVVDAVDEVA